jgi:NADPH:quinone reductase-like Zn-dependent oxidoreductase
MKTIEKPQAVRPISPNRNRMISIVQHKYGTDPKVVLGLTEIAQPPIVANQVLVQVKAASVDMGTWHCMTGMPYAMRLLGFGIKAPKAANPGRAIAGVVESVADGVTGFKIGDEVYGSCAAAFAQFAAVDVSQLAPKPSSLTFEQAAALPISAGTALQAIRKGDLRPGQKVLVVGASGGVGSFAVQIAKAFGADVTGVCSNSKMDLVRALGADHVIDYTQEDFTKTTERYNLIIDTGGSRPLNQLRRMLTHEGVLVIVGGETGGRWFGGFVGRSVRAKVLSMLFPQTLVMLASKEEAEVLNSLRDLVEAEHIAPAIDRTFPLLDTAAALQYLKSGRTRGKIVITI